MDLNPLPAGVRSPAAETSVEHLDALIVGAGISGVDMAYRLQTGDPGVRYAILEARGAVGGTWDLFRFPGVRSDSDMATLGFPFRPWRGARIIAQGPDIRAYIEDTARAFGIDRRIRLNHRVIAAAWSSEAGRWTVEYETAARRGTLTCSFLIACSGYYDYAQGHAPEWPGMQAFAGRIVHPQFWPDDLEVEGRRVVLIGSGATAVTLAPALAEAGAAHVTLLQRSPSYIMSVPAVDPRDAGLRRWAPPALADRLIRWKYVLLAASIYRVARRRPEGFKRFLAQAQRRALGPDFDMTELTPRYQPWDERLCFVPDEDLFRAIRQGRVAIRTDQIEGFTPTGLRLQSGAGLAADIVVSATGLKLQFLGGAALAIDGERVDPGERLTYRGAMLDGVPNFAFAIGYTNASWTLRCDLTARLVSRLVRRLRRRGFAAVRPVAPSAARTDGPIFDLKSGYVRRGAHVLPRQGAFGAWRVHHDYLRDLVGHAAARIGGGALRFERST